LLWWEFGGVVLVPVSSSISLVSNAVVASGAGALLDGTLISPPIFVMVVMIQYSWWCLSSTVVLVYIATTDLVVLCSSDVLVK
jgi:hypothetical protein